MPGDNEESIKQAVWEATEVALAAQLRALRRLRKGLGGEDDGALEKRMSQMDMACAILHEAEGPMHVNELLAAITKRFGVEVDRESLVSALSKRVKRRDRFVRSAPNTFALKEEEE